MSREKQSTFISETAGEARRLKREEGSEAAKAYIVEAKSTPEYHSYRRIKSILDQRHDDGMPAKFLDSIRADLTVENLQDEEFVVRCIQDLETHLVSISTDARQIPAELSVLGKIRALAKSGTTALALLAALEVFFTNRAFASEESAKPYAEVERLPGQVRRAAMPGIKSGKRHIEFRGTDSSIILEHQLRIPRSLAEAGKIFVEPVTLMLTMPYERGNKSLIAKIFMDSRDKDPKAFTVDVDIPYQYARDFETASPADQKKMEQEMLSNAKEFFERLLPAIAGPSFFKKEIAQEHGRSEESSAQITKLSIAGFASPEGEGTIGADTVRNRKLAKLRAENAATVLKNIFKQYGVGVEAIEYQGRGEAQFSQDEITQLLQLSHELRLERDGAPDDQNILALIKRYNDGEIKMPEAVRKLNALIGSKRKVAIHVEVAERKGILVVPVPLFLLLIAGVLGRRRREDDERLRQQRYADLEVEHRAREEDLRNRAREMHRPPE